MKYAVIYSLHGCVTRLIEFAVFRVEYTIIPISNCYSTNIIIILYIISTLIFSLDTVRYVEWPSWLMTQHVSNM